VSHAEAPSSRRRSAPSRRASPGDRNGGARPEPMRHVTNQSQRLVYRERADENDVATQPRVDVRLHRTAGSGSGSTSGRIWKNSSAKRAFSSLVTSAATQRARDQRFTRKTRARMRRGPMRRRALVMNVRDQCDATAWHCRGVGTQDRAQHERVLVPHTSRPCAQQIGHGRDCPRQQCRTMPRRSATKMRSSNPSRAASDFERRASCQLTNAPHGNLFTTRTPVAGQARRLRSR
jgi:hypothetical protein